jgi:type I restriction enzyme R subunit
MNQPDDKAARIQIRLLLKKYALPVTGLLFDNAYAYIREDY